MGGFTDDFANYRGQEHYHKEVADKPQRAVPWAGEVTPSEIPRPEAEDFLQPGGVEKIARIKDDCHEVPDEIWHHESWDFAFSLL